jgi:cobyrinic acid a,c-diamide synthase
LSQNQGLREAIRDFGLAGKVIYAECGGFMYLTQGITDNQGRTWPMIGLLPVEVRMLERLKSLGYREVTLTGKTPLGPEGMVIRGHEFHYSEVTRSDPMSQVYRVTGRKGPVDDAAGYLKDNILAGYVHLHFGSCPEAAANLVAACASRA